MSGLMLALRVLLSLACVIALIWYVGRRWGGQSRSAGTSREANVQVVGRQSMGRHAGVAVVAVGSRRLLIGYGEQQVNLLTELAPVVEIQPAPTVPKSPTVPKTPKVATKPALPEQRSGELPAGVVDSLRATPLQGSVLSPATWRQAVRSLQDRTVRR
ncbi:FliO/MopB family protein [Cellulomonas sp. URHB0016]